MAKRAAAVLVRAVRAAEADAAASDRELLRRFAEAGDQAAFAEVTARHGAMVFGVCKRVLHSPADAEDACQAVFLILAKKAGGNRWQASVANWLYAAARKVAGNARVAASRRVRREGAAAVAEAVPPADPLTGPEVLAALDEELERLPPRYREPLVLCYLEGLTRDEAAARLGVPEATLKSQLERGRKKLADALTARGCALGVALLLTATSSAGASPSRLAESIRAGVGGAPSARALAFAKGVSVNGFAVRTKLLALAAVAAAVTGFAFAPATAPPQPGGDKMEKPAAKAEPPKAEAGERTVSGTVLGADGKPAAGAKLFHPVAKTARPVSIDDLVLKEVARTDAAGRFRATLTGKAPRDYLIAHAPGSGVDWVENPSGDVALRLVPDVPIRGRVLTTEGKPAAGVRVTVVAVYVPAEKLDGYLAMWKSNLREAMASPTKRVYAPLTSVTGAATTGDDGRFSLGGVGGERIAHLIVEGGGTARQNPMVVTRAAFDPKPYNDVLLRKEHEQLRVLNSFRGLNGPDLTLVAERGKTIEGVVTDAATGKPVAGATVGTSTGFGDGVTAQSGADGKYKLDGVPKRSPGYGVYAHPPDGAGYMSASGAALDTDGFTPVRHDIKLARGVVVTGRVVDKQTGRGVRAGVRFAPLPGNTYFGKGPGSDAYRADRTMTSTDKDGRFRISTIPGKTLLMVQAQGDDKFNGEHMNPYRVAEPDPGHKELFKYDADDDSWSVNAVDNTIEFLGTEHAVRVLDLKETGETAVEVALDRGRTARLEVRDADGRPLPGAFVAGMTAAWPVTYKLPEAGCTVYALNPDRPRTIGVYHPAKNLGGVATVRGDEKDPVVVRLAPAGTVTGRLMDEDGAPLSGAEVTVNARRTVFSELYRFTAKDRPRTVTDAKGQFSLPAVVPGMEFFLQIRKGEQYFAGRPKLGAITLKPGETKAFGDRTVEVLR